MNRTCPMESGGRFRYNIRMMSMIRVKDIGLLRASCMYFVRTLSVSEDFSNHGLRILRAGMHVVKSRPNLNRPGGKNLS